MYEHCIWILFEIHQYYPILYAISILLQLCYDKSTQTYDLSSTGIGSAYCCY